MKNNQPSPLNGKTLSNIIVICVGVLLFLTLSNFAQVRKSVTWFLAIFNPFVAGLVIAYLLNMPMRFFETKIFKNLLHKRVLSIVSAYLMAILVLFLLMRMVLPQTVESIQALFMNLSVYLKNLNGFLQGLGARFDVDPEYIQSFMVNYNDLVRDIMLYVRNIMPNIISYTMQIGSGLITALTAIIASVYMLSGKDKLLKQGQRVAFAFLPRAKAIQLMRVGKLSNQVFSGFISGKLLDSAIIGVICFVFMNLMSILSSSLQIDSINMPFALLISVIIGVTNIIPFFGPFIGAVPSTMILLMVNPKGALWFVIFVVFLQQFDGNILGPKILGNSTGLPAMWVLISIIVGQGLFGFSGMLLGVPTAAVLYALTSEFIEARLKQKGLNKRANFAYHASGDGLELNED